MKINEKYYEEKINKINNLLNDEKLFSKYILDIENNELEVPPNLEKNIGLSIKSKVDLRKNKYRFFSILKVACFCLVVMLTWTAMTNISFNKKEQFASEENNNMKEENKISVIYGKVTEFTNNFSNFLLSPIEIERGN